LGREEREKGFGLVKLGKVSSNNYLDKAFNAMSLGVKSKSKVASL